MSYVNNSFDFNEDFRSSPSKLEYSAPNSNWNKPVSLAWRNLRFEVCQLWGKKKVILNRLNGHFEANSLNGLMGPSGAGKTTLLNCLSGTTSSGLSLDTEILVPSTLTHPTSCFIEQHVHETIVGRLTVGQIFRYAFYFKNTPDDSPHLEAHINKTLLELLLPPDILNRYFEHCSGGEQKRIAIGQELMSLKKPDFLWLDEPTTGLDSSAAFEVVRCLKDLTINYRITVVASIHAPNHETLGLFDKLYVLAKGGVCIYSGTPGGINGFLEDELGSKEGRVGVAGVKQPPVEKLIKIACNCLATPQVATLSTKCLQTEYSSITQNLSQLTQLPHGLPNNRKSFKGRDLYLQARRQLRITFLSNFHIFFCQVLFYVANMAFLSTVFSKDMVGPSGCYSLANDSSSTCRTEIAQSSLIYENINFLCVSISVVGFCIISTSTVLFAPVAKVFRNEHRNKWYSLSVFFWSTTLTSLLELISLVLFIALSAYFFTGQQAAIDPKNLNLNLLRVAHYIFCMFLKSFYSQSIGQLMGTLIVSSSTTALVLSNLIYTVLDTFNDFYIKADELGIPALVWFSNIVGFKYINRYMFYIFYGLGRCNLQSEYSLVLLKNLVDPTQIWFYITRILTNILLIKLATLVIMYFKFNTFRIFQKLNRKSANSASEMKGIDFQPGSAFIDFNNNRNYLATIKKSSSELSFNEFSRHKIIIAFKHLTLFKTNSIYEYNLTDHTDPNELILNHLHGYFRFGTLNALMGMSGAGKTSLLRILNGQCKTRLGPETQIFLSKFTKIQTCFIAQEISYHLLPGLTAKQSLLFASRLKNLGVDVDHEKIAENILAELSLKDIGGTLVQRCSGGERKRLALALELTSLEMPNLVCIDEPTSGLDSNSAEIVISCLRKLAATHSLTIIASIHQPSTEIIQSFDQLYVLARGGVCVYSGSPSSIQEHLDLVSGTAGVDDEVDDDHLQTKSSHFPIEQLISYSCAGPQSEIVQKLIAVNNAKILQNSNLTQNTQIAPDGILKNRPRFSFASTLILSHRYLIFILGHLWKEWLAFALILFYYANNLHIYWPSTAIATVSGCVSLEDDLNATCSRTESSIVEEKMLQDNVKYNMFMCILFLLFIVLQASLTLHRELKYFLNEHRNGWYSTGAFYLTKCIFELLPLIPILLIYVYICDIYSPTHPGIYTNLFIILLLTVTATQAVSHIFILFSQQNFQIASIMFLSIFELFLLLSNFFINLSRLHYIYQYLSNLNTARFALEAALLLQYGFGRCRPSEIQPILAWMNLTDDHYYVCLRMILLHIVLYRAIALQLMIRKVNSRDNRRQRMEKIVGHLERLKLRLWTTGELNLKQYHI